MKKISMSIIAVAMLASAASADIKVKSFGGDAKLFFSAVNKAGVDFGKKENNMGDAAIDLNGALSVGKGQMGTINWGITGISTLGLDGHLVNNTWIKHQQSSTDANLSDGVWIDTLNLTVNPFENTTLVIGRQQLDTPMVFSEQWNIAPNTYDAVVAVNNSFQNTTLVGAWVGRSNIAGGSTVQYYKNEEAFKNFGTADGAYAFAIVNKSFCDTTLQAWYFNVVHTATVGWLQADTKLNGIDFGAQYASRNPAATGAKTGNAMAVKVGYDFNGLGLTAAYSKVSDDGQNFVNVGGGQSKLYTDAWWSVGTVAGQNTKATTVTAIYDFGIVNASLFYTAAKQSKSTLVANETKTNETTLTLDKTLGSLDASLAFVNVQSKVDGVDQASDNEIQAYLTYHF